MAGTSVDPPSTPLPGTHEIAPEDLQTVCKLYQKCPQLWADFRNLIDFLDLLTENSQAYKQLHQHLLKMGSYFENHFSDGKEDDFLLFAVAMGFVERSVQFSRQIMREMGKTYVTEFPPFSRVNTGFDMQCLHLLRSHYLNCTLSSSQFRLRLAQTGFFEDLMEDIRHIKHLSGEALDRGNVYLLSLGTIHNCLRHPDVIPIVKQMDIVPHVAPFLDKRSRSKCDFTATSPHLAEVLADQVNMLTILGMGQVEFVLDQLTNLTAEGGNSSSDVTRAKVLQALTELAGDEGCRREIMARGGLSAVKKILQRGENEEQTQAAKVVLELVSCEENRVVVKNDDALIALLRVFTRNITKCTCPELQQVAENVLQALNS